MHFSKAGAARSIWMSGKIRDLLRVEFSQDSIAPLINYAGEVGTLGLVDTGGVYSASGGVLVPNSAVSGSNDPIIFSSSPFAWKGGRGMVSRVRLESSLGAATWNNQVLLRVEPTSGAAFGMRANSALWRPQDNGNLAGQHAAVADTWYVISLVMRPGAGMWYFLDKKLAWVGTMAILQPLYALITKAPDGSYPFSVDYVRIRDFGDPFDTDFGFAHMHQASPTGNYTGVADGIFDLTGITLPGSPSANQRAAELVYNRLDANNYNVAYIVRNGANTLWSFLMDTVVAGVATNRITVGNAGTPDTIRVCHTGNLHDCYTAAAGTWAKRGAQVNNSNQAATVGVGVLFNGGTAAFLDVWKYDDPIYSVLDAA